MPAKAAPRPPSQKPPERQKFYLIEGGCERLLVEFIYLDGHLKFLVS
jgi:hypothetical protein